MYQVSSPTYVWLYALFILDVISNNMDENAHGENSSNEVVFVTAPETIQFMYYIFWDPVYYYDTYEMFLKTKDKLHLWIGPTKNFGGSLAYLILLNKQTFLA